MSANQELSVQRRTGHPLVNLEVSRDEVVAIIQTIYAKFQGVHEQQQDDALLWQDLGFRNGIILLRNSFEYFERIPLINNQKVLLVCKQFHGNESNCLQYTIHNRLGMRWNTIAMCKSCREKEKHHDETEDRIAKKNLSFKEKYKNLQSLVQKQQKRIKRLQDSVKIQKEAVRKEKDHRVKETSMNHSVRIRNSFDFSVNTECEPDHHRFGPT
jgi:hypothetical protein